MKTRLLFACLLCSAGMTASAQSETSYQPLPFLEGNPIWVYKFERLNRAPGWKNGVRYGCFIDTGDRHFTYYFLGKQKEIDGKVYTMVGEITSRGEDELTVNRWLPVREENGAVYTLTDSLLYICEHEGYPYSSDELPYLQQGNECVLYNFCAEIGERLDPQDEYSEVESIGTYQLVDGTVCRVLKTIWGYKLCDKLGFLNFDLPLGIMGPYLYMVVPLNGHVYVKQLNAFYQDEKILYEAPVAHEGLCVNDTCWTREDAGAYACSYRVDPRQEEVFSYIRRLQTATGTHNPESKSPVNEPTLIYDLSGRKMMNGKLPRGIYIENGKKKVK